VTQSVQKNPTRLDDLIGPWLALHRVGMVLALVMLVALLASTMRWDWIPTYADQLVGGLLTTLLLLFSTTIAGFLLACMLGFVQVTGPRPLAWLGASFCGVIRGTPLLLQIWLLYYGVGSLFAQYPEFRREYPELFSYLRQAWPYAFVSLTLSFAGYEGEVMRGAFAGVPRGELEAARAFGMSRWTTLRRIWLPRAIYRALPTINGDIIGQMKSTPLVATITVFDIYGVIAKIRQDTYLTYEPLLFVAGVYLILTGLLVMLFRKIENRISARS
jgi:polar amino acid transport system permease protein